MTRRCVGKGELFDSTDPKDHAEARRLCLGCPGLDWCRDQTAAAIAAADPTLRNPIVGTWAGDLYGGDPMRARASLEDAMFSEEDARAAHAAWGQGVRDERTRIGERAYQRQIKRARRAAA